ncbi:hypothetical protein OH77DRAFT_136927 [Trametes cingulata]|nr:hypothetical protein OH77DRAFT_136927 [Trametes cingulata]
MPRSELVLRRGGRRGHGARYRSCARPRTSCLAARTMCRHPGRALAVRTPRPRGWTKTELVEDRPIAGSRHSLNNIEALGLKVVWFVEVNEKVERHEVEA